MLDNSNFTTVKTPKMTVILIVHVGANELFFPAFSQEHLQVRSNWDNTSYIAKVSVFGFRAHVYTA